MQERFDFGAPDLAQWRSSLAPLLEGKALWSRRTPVGQLVKSMISGRTRDVVSLAAYHRLNTTFGSAAGLGRASVVEIQDVIGDVTFPAAKAEWLVGALARIAKHRPDFDLSFLGKVPLSAAIEWLEELPGVGRKVAASTLNASTLSRPVFIVDTHVLRILRRLGFVGPHVEIRAASEAVTAASPYWSGDDFLLFHVAMKALGQSICTFDAPRCEVCPLASTCLTAKRRLN